VRFIPGPGLAWFQPRPATRLNFLWWRLPDVRLQQRGEPAGRPCTISLLRPQPADLAVNPAAGCGLAKAARARPTPGAQRLSWRAPGDSIDRPAAPVAADEFACPSKKRNASSLPLEALDLGARPTAASLRPRSDGDAAWPRRSRSADTSPSQKPRQARLPASPKAPADVAAQATQDLHCGQHLERPD